MRPYFVFPVKRMITGPMKDASPFASGTVPGSVWSNLQVIEHYLTKYFVTFVPGRSDSQFMVLLDVHRSHVALVLAE